MKVLKIQRKNLLNMKIVVIYLNFVFFIEVKTKSKYRILNFVSQFIKKTKWHFGNTDLHQPSEHTSMRARQASDLADLCLAERFVVLESFCTLKGH